MADEATSTETVTETTTEGAPPAVDTSTALGGAEADGSETEQQADATDAKADESGEADKTEGDDEAPVVPEKYELTVSEGIEIDAAALEAATPVFQELGLTNDQAQKLMPVAEQFAASIRAQGEAAILASVQAERAAWLNEAKADPEIGGAQWDSNLVIAAKALDGLGFTKGSAFRTLLDDSGLGNHPEMIRAFVKVGKAISEDTDFARGGATSAPRSDAQIIYGPKA